MLTWLPETVKEHFLDKGLCTSGAAHLASLFQQGH